MAVPFPNTFDIIGPVLQPTLLVVGLYVAIKIGMPIAGRLRQHAYEQATEAKAVSLVISPPVGLTPDPELSVELIRALHPRQRRGFDAWRVGWPSIELRVVHRGGELGWEIVANSQVAALAENALRTICPGAMIDVGRALARPASAVAVGRLASSSSWPVREIDRAEARVLHRFAAAVEAASSTAEVRLRVIARPVPPEAWQKAIASPSSTSSPSMSQVIGAAIIDGLLVHKSRFDDRSTSAASSLSPEERDAQKLKRRGVVGFDVGLVLEVAGLPADQAEALLWRLVDFTHPLSDGHQEIRWKIQRGAVGSPPRARLADWELAQLWYLPDASFDRAGFVRDRPLAAPPPAAGSGELGLVVAESRGRPLAIPIRILPRHVIALGATGSGKSTLLLTLALAAIEADISTTVIDPHGDLVADILCRIPRSAVDRIHVLRLADRAHPRGSTPSSAGRPATTS